MCRFFRTVFFYSKLASLLIVGASSALAYEVITDVNVQVAQVTEASDASVYPPTFIRHEYSRRPAFNADSSRVIMYSSNGFFHLYRVNPDNTLRYEHILDRIGGGIIEPNWHPTDPNLLYTLNSFGIGMQLNLFDVRDQTRVAVVDMAAPIHALGGGFASADRAFTGEEGRPSRDGKVWCLAVYSGDDWVPRGMVAYDLERQAVIAHREISEGFDAVSTSPSGEYCVTIGGYGGSGIRAYKVSDRAFATFRQLHPGPEHVDLALDADGRDVLVYIDSVNDGHVKAVDLATGTSVRFFNTWDAAAPPAAHFSGLGYAQPGWAIVSLYGGTSSSFYHNKILAVEITKHPRIVVLADSGHNGGGYWAQPQATVNGQLDKVLFSSDASGEIADHMISLQQPLPAARGILTGDEGGTEPPSPAPADFTVSGEETVTFQQAGMITLTVTTSEAAACRWDYADGNAYPFNALYQSLTTVDGLSHQFSEYAWADHALLVVCQHASGAEANLTIQVVREEDNDTPTPGSPTADVLTITADAEMYYQQEGDITVQVQTNVAAQCRWDYADGNTYLYAMLYQDMASPDGVLHSLSTYAWGDHELLVVCRSDGGSEADSTIRVRRMP